MGVLSDENQASELVSHRASMASTITDCLDSAGFCPDAIRIPAKELLQLKPSRR